MTDTSTPGAAPAARPPALVFPDTRGWLAARTAKIAQVIALALLAAGLRPDPDKSKPTDVIRGDHDRKCIGAGFLSIINYFFGSLEGCGRRAGAARPSAGQASGRGPMSRHLFSEILDKATIAVGALITGAIIGFAAGLLTHGSI